MLFYLSSFSQRKYDHVTHLLRNLHWLPVWERIAYCPTVMAFRFLHGAAPPSLLLNSIYLLMTILDGGFNQRTQWRLSIRDQSTQRLVPAFFQSQQYASGTVGHLLSHHFHHCQYSSGNWRQSFSPALILPLNAKQIFRICRIKPEFIIVFVTWPWSSSELYVSLMRSFIIIIIIIIMRQQTPPAWLDSFFIYFNFFSIYTLSSS